MQEKNEKLHINEKRSKNKKIILSRCYRIFLFFIMMNMDMTMDISSGIFSSAGKNIKNQLKLTDAKFGGFGTATSIGRIISFLISNFFLNIALASSFTFLIFSSRFLMTI